MIKIRLLKEWCGLSKGAVIPIDDPVRAQELVNLGEAKEVETSYLTPLPDKKPERTAPKAKTAQKTAPKVTANGGKKK